MRNTGSGGSSLEQPPLSGASHLEPLARSPGYGPGAEKAEQPSLPQVRRLDVLGLGLDAISVPQALERIRALLDQADAVQVSFVNAHCANVACADPHYAGVLTRAALVLPDGIGVRMAAQMTGQAPPDNVNGTDLFPLLCEALEGTAHGVFLLGGRPGVAESVRDWIARYYPDVTVCGVHHGHFTPDEESQVVDKIRASGAHLLLVAMGVPRQELWLDAHLTDSGARVGMGVGGLFDFYSCTIPRAPTWMRRHGLEWMYRLYQEPGRMWRRYVVGNPLFLARVAANAIYKPR